MDKEEIKSVFKEFFSAPSLYVAILIWVVLLGATYLLTKGL
ncbi:hypothetical protein [Zooshikella sp. RANM57]